MSANLPIRRPAGTPRPGVVAHTIAALLAPTTGEQPMTDAIDDFAEMLAAFRDCMARVEAVAAKRQARERTGLLRRWLG